VFEVADTPGELPQGVFGVAAGTLVFAAPVSVPGPFDGSVAEVAYRCPAASSALRPADTVLVVPGTSEPTGPLPSPDPGGDEDVQWDLGSTSSPVVVHLSVRGKRNLMQLMDQKGW